MECHYNKYRRLNQSVQTRRKEGILRAQLGDVHNPFFSYFTFSNKKRTGLSGSYGTLLKRSQERKRKRKTTPSPAHSVYLFP